jgi:hypothetical protein
MRTAEELITELDEVASDVERAALVISFPDTTVLAWRDDPNRLEVLQHAMDGGEPVGHISALAEFADNRQVLQHAMDLGGEPVGYITVNLGMAVAFPLREYGEDALVPHRERLTGFAGEHGYEILFPKGRMRRVSS